MEQSIAPSVAPSSDSAQDRSGVSWHDLREWIALIERNGELQRIGKDSEFADGELVAAAMAAEHDARAGRQQRQVDHLFPRELRNWSPIWVDRTGHVFQPHSWAAQRSLSLAEAIRVVNQALGQMRMRLEIIRRFRHLRGLWAGPMWLALEGR